MKALTNYLGAESFLPPKLTIRRRNKPMVGGDHDKYDDHTQSLNDDIRDDSLHGRILCERKHTLKKHHPNRVKALAELLQH